MITWIRTATIHDGKMEEAFTWGVKVSRYLNEKIEGLDVQVYRNVSGPVYQIHWIASYDSLKAFEKRWKEIEGDKGYQDLLKEVRDKGAFVGSGVVDSLLQRVS